MLRNFIKVAFRNLLRKKTFAFINIFGLATGMAVCMLIILFIRNELSYDNFHAKGDQVYRLVLERKYPGRATSYAIIPQSIGEAVKKELPEVKESMRIFNANGNNGGLFLKYGDKVFEEKSILFADSNFFRVFSSTMLAGNAEDALMKPNSVVLNETTAKKYFGSVQDAIGKILLQDNAPSWAVTGVVRDWPENSHFLFDLLVSSTTIPNIRDLNYINFSATTYFLLNPGTSQAAFQAKLPEVIEKYVAGPVQLNFAQNYTEWQAAGNGYHYYLQPLRKIHLTSDLEAELRPNGSITVVYIFTVIAVFILLLACINFINLSTARSLERAKEVGMRKTFGSERWVLIGQFLMESILISVLALVLASALIFFLLPYFNSLADKDLKLLDLFQPGKILLMLLFSIGVGLLAGLYPAFVLSSFKPIQVLKGKFSTNKIGYLLRNGLVIFQFAISVILIVSTILVNRQLDFMLGNKVGFRKDHIVILERTDMLDKQTEAFKNELKKLGGVEDITGNFSMPGQGNFFGISFQAPGAKQPMTGRAVVVDEGYQSTLALEMKEGRFFSKSFSTDSLSVVLNEKAVEELELQKPLGAQLTTPDGFLNKPDGKPNNYTVIGVLKNFHFQSLHQKIEPLIVLNVAKFGNIDPVIAVRIKGDAFNSVIGKIENLWNNFIKQRPFHYTFFDQQLARQYTTENRTQRVFTVFSILAICIACIGLLGLATYATQQRVREIGIRKVLGASVGQVIKLLSLSFLKLVLYSSLIAIPVAWWAMHKWLQDFAYRVDISIWIFVVAVAGALLVALLTISIQAIQAALANPVKSLRSE